jgi:hypothetical protein
MPFAQQGVKGSDDDDDATQQSTIKKSYYIRSLSFH